MVGCDESAPRREIYPPWMHGRSECIQSRASGSGSARCDARAASPTTARAGVGRRPDPRGYHPAAAGRAVFHAMIQTRSGEPVHCAEPVHCNASDTRNIVTNRNPRLAIKVINVDRMRRELVESLLEDSEAARWASVDLVDKETAPGLGAARGVLLGIVLGAVCWLVIIAAGCLVLKMLS